MYPLVARCFTSLMYASLPARGSQNMPVWISARSLLFFISVRRLYSSIISSGMAHGGGVYLFIFAWVVERCDEVEIT